VHDDYTDGMATPRVLILRSPGANCDGETRFAFERAGAEADLVHINRLRENPKLLHDYQILCIPGGFSYGDDIAAGKILAHQLMTFLADEIRRFRDKEKLILGVCNGFQVILKAGLLIPPDEDGPLATLAHNRHGRFEDRWIHMTATPGHCVWLKDIEQMHLPIAHGEGAFVSRKEWILKGLAEAGQIVLRYAEHESSLAGEQGAKGAREKSSPPLPALSSSAIQIAELPFPINPNGSQGNVAGVCDATGRVLGLMPHPERHVLGTQHPRWTREGLKDEGEGLKLFRNAVEYFETI
jgi:phosphoribosylformylglycinamidine synthase subunit PurQ / glutaminase